MNITPPNAENREPTGDVGQAETETTAAVSPEPTLDELAARIAGEAVQRHSAVLQYIGTRRQRDTTRRAYLSRLVKDGRAITVTLAVGRIRDWTDATGRHTTEPYPDLYLTATGEPTLDRAEQSPATVGEYGDRVIIGPAVATFAERVATLTEQHRAEQKAAEREFQRIPVGRAITRLWVALADDERSFVHASPPRADDPLDTEGRYIFTARLTEQQILAIADVLAADFSTENIRAASKAIRSRTGNTASYAEVRAEITANAPTTSPKED